MPEVATQVPAAMFFLRYAAGELPVPFTAESLAADWRTGRAVRLAGLRRGDVVTLASTTFRVLWPPQILPSTRAKNLKTALEQVRDIAREDPYFGPLYDELHENPFGVGDDEADDLKEGWQWDLEKDGTELAAEDEGVEDDEAAGGFADLPNELVESAKIIHRWNNDLSLVLAATDDSFLAMGDVTSRWAVAGALQSAAPLYTRMLAPHHGTHGDQNLPSADECFMQTGHGHSTRTHRHMAAHGQAMHVCTHTTRRPGSSVRQIAACTDATCQHPSTGGFFRG